MKLLFDENLSATLARVLGDVFPGSRHLRDLSLTGADDHAIWIYAAKQNYIIVTKDDDFRDLSILHGAPPKLVIVRLGNCSTAAIERLLRQSCDDLNAFSADESAALMEIP